MATDSTSGSRASTRPSSSTSELFGGIYARGAVAEAVDDDGTWHVLVPPAPYLAVHVFARGLLRHLTTRIYLDAEADDPVLASVAAERRETLLAERTEDGYRFDIRIQGERETVFFDV